MCHCHNDERTWVVRASTDDVDEGVRCASIAIPWSPQVRDASSQSQQTCALDLARTVTAQEALRRPLAHRGLWARVKRLDHRSAAMLDFLVDGVGKLDLRILDGASLPIRDGDRLSVADANIPMSVPKDRIADTVDAYCFAVADSVNGGVKTYQLRRSENVPPKVLGMVYLPGITSSCSGSSAGLTVSV